MDGEVSKLPESPYPKLGDRLFRIHYQQGDENKVTTVRASGGRQAIRFAEIPLNEVRQLEVMGGEDIWLQCAGWELEGLTSIRRGIEFEL